MRRGLGISKILFCRMSSRLLCSKLYPNVATSLCRSLASSSQQTLSRSSRQEPELIVFDAPSRPSELTRRSARSSSLTDYYNARRRLVSSSPARQTRSSASSSAMSSTANVSAQCFDRPSRPRAYYTRPQRKQGLPKVQVCS